jgi:hypothetical protein
MVLTAGITDVSKLIAGDTSGKPFTKIVVGTSNTAVTGTETSLTGQVEKNILTVDYLDGGYVQFSATLDASTPSMIIQEMGLLNSDDTLCYRQVITPAVATVTGATYALSYKIKIQ